MCSTNLSFHLQLPLINEINSNLNVQLFHLPATKEMTSPHTLRVGDTMKSMNPEQRHILVLLSYLNFQCRRVGKYWKILRGLFQCKQPLCKVPVRCS